MRRFFGAVRQRIGRSNQENTEVSLPPASQIPITGGPAVDIDPNDPLIEYFQRSTGAVDIDTLELSSPGVEALRAAGIKLVVPLVSQGELMGLLNLGPRLSEQEYSSDDRRLLDNLAAHAAPAVRVAQLVRQHEAEAKERESIEQELRIAHMIQQSLLPKRLPALTGWEVGSYYQPARAVGGDFYDFIDFPDGKIGIVIGDASDKGVPAALVMATTRTMLRASAQRLLSPAQVLARTNEVLSADIPPNMFVTCLYALLDPTSGLVRFANAGHNLPCLRTAHGVVELRATGWPLGLLPNVSYDEYEATINPGDLLVLYSDGVIEAHNSEREMFGTGRLKQVMDQPEGTRELLDLLLSELNAFADPREEQEDDITLVTLERVAMAAFELELADGAGEALGSGNGSVRLLAKFTVPSEPGNERLVMDAVQEAVAALELPERTLERLKTAVAEATMNAIEHGNQNRAELPVTVTVVTSGTSLSVRISDQGGGKQIPEPQVPDLEAKLAGLQSPRGWGLFLIKNMVDEMHVSSDEQQHTIELVIHLEGSDDGR